MGHFVRVAAASDIPAGQGKTVEVGWKTIAVFNCNGDSYAIDNIYKHEGGPLGEGDLDGTIATCSWPGWTYDVTTGISPDDASCAVDRYEVRVDGEDILVDI